MIDNLLIAAHAFASCISMSFSVDVEKMLLPRYYLLPNSTPLKLYNQNIHI